MPFINVVRTGQDQNGNYINWMPKSWTLTEPECANVANQFTDITYDPGNQRTIPDPNDVRGCSIQINETSNGRTAEMFYNPASETYSSTNSSNPNSTKRQVFEDAQTWCNNHTTFTLNWHNCKGWTELQRVRNCTFQESLGWQYDDQQSAWVFHEASCVSL